MRIIEVETGARQELVDITERVEAVVAETGVEDGACVVWSLHTTAGITVNESADPAVARDIEGWLGERVPRDAGYRHAEGNSDSHIKTTLVGPGLVLIVAGGHLELGTWQGVFLCEFDGPRRRRVAVQPLPGA